MSIKYCPIPGVNTSASTISSIVDHCPFFALQDLRIYKKYSTLMAMLLLIE